MDKSTIFVFLACFGVSCATYNSFQWSNCGSDNALTYSNIDVSPVPLVMPGPVYFSMEGVTTRPIGDVKIDVSVKRETFLINIPIPCVQHFGSCTYRSTCSQTLFDTMIKENWAGITRPVGQKLREMYNDMVGGNVTCPSQPKHFSIRNYKIDLPAMPSLLAFFAEGDYSMKIKTTEDTVNGPRDVSCLQMKISFKKKEKPCTGFICV